MPVLRLDQTDPLSLPYQGKDQKQQCIYWDKALSSFGVRVYASGRRAYVCSYRIHHRKRLAVLGQVNALTLDQARKLAISYLSKAAIHDDPQDQTGRRSIKTVAGLCAAYIEHYAKKKLIWWKKDESCIRRWILPNLGLRLATTIVSADIENIHTEIGTQHPNAANHLLALMRCMYNWAKVAGIVPQDYPSPILGIRWFPKRRRRRYITAAEIPRFIRALEAEDNEYARHGIWLLLLTGLRSKELLNSLWTDIDWDFGTLFIGRTKNGEPLLAPLSDAAISSLKSIPQIPDNPYIICGFKPNRPLSGLGGPLRRVLGRAGLENIHVHDLRRTVGSWLAQSGTSLHLIGDILNHRDLRTTLGYAYFQTEQRRAALNEYGSKIMALAGVEPTSREPMAPMPLSTAGVLEFTGPAPRFRHYFKREVLHELVWTAPVLELSRRLGVSDVGLAKLCRRAAIPVPGRGYWARTESGQTIGRVPLPAAPEGLPSLLRIRGTKQPMTAASSAA